MLALATAAGLVVLAYQPFGIEIVISILFFLGPLILVPALSLVVRPGRIIVAGIAFSLFAYFVAFMIIVKATKPEGPFGLVYFLFLPGALIGALAAGALLRKQSRWVAFTLTIVSVAAGILINMALIYLFISER